MTNFWRITNNQKKIALIGLSLLILIVIVVFLWQVYCPLDRRGSEKIFEIKTGQSLRSIAFNLEDEEIIDSPWLFVLYLWLNRQTGSLQAGSYNLSPAQNIPSLVKQLTEGKVIKDWAQITIPEGWTSSEIKDRLVSNGVLLASDYENYQPLVEKYPFLADRPARASLEGYLFPDTYYFSHQANPSEVIGKMLANFGRQLDEKLIAEINRQGQTIYQIVIMASIVQSEASSVEEMPQIASVFYNRLELNMALQSDATVNYITGKKNRQPSRADTRIDSLYNTYFYRGLPLGPISNPGIEAIKAAIYPAQTDYLYFLHPKTGSSAIFSKTLEGHNQNKAKYLN